jgi:hypothetical protein
LVVVFIVGVAGAAFFLAVGVLASAVIDGGGFLGAFHLVIELVGLGSDVLSERLGAAELPLLLQIGMLLDLGAAEDSAGKRVEIGHERLRFLPAKTPLSSAFIEGDLQIR